MKKSKAPAAVPYDDILLEDLKDLNFAANYLTACIDGDSDEDFEVFFSAIGKIMKAQGMSLSAKKMGVSRDALYKAFTKHRNPTIKTFRQMLNSVDLDIAIVPKHA